MSNEQVMVQPQAVGMLTAFRDLPQMMQVAGLIADSTIVPKTYQGQPGNVLIALNTAQRLQLDPMMVMQNLYVVYGTPSWSGQFCIAALKLAPQYRRIVFEFLNGKDWHGGMRVVGYRRDDPTNEAPDYGPEVTPEIVHAEGWDKPKKLKDGSGMQQSRWVTNPELMYRYRSASEFVRTCCPEVLMGLPTVDAVEDEQNAGRGLRNVTPQEEDPQQPQQVKPAKVRRRAVPQEKEPQADAEAGQKVQEQVQPQAEQVQPQVAERPQAEVTKPQQVQDACAVLQEKLREQGARWSQFAKWCEVHEVVLPETGSDRAAYNKACSAVLADAALMQAFEEELKFN